MTMLTEGRFVELSENRYVGIAKTTDEDDYSAKMLLFRSKTGEQNNIVLSFEAFEALRNLLVDERYGVAGFETMNKYKRQIDIAGELYDLVYKVVPFEEVEAARKTAENNDAIEQAT